MHAFPGFSPGSLLAPSKSPGPLSCDCVHLGHSLPPPPGSSAALCLRAPVGLHFCGLTSVMELILAASLPSGVGHSAFLWGLLKVLPSPAYCETGAAGPHWLSCLSSVLSSGPKDLILMCFLITPPQKVLAGAFSSCRPCGQRSLLLLS